MTKKPKKRFESLGVCVSVTSPDFSMTVVPALTKTQREILQMLATGRFIMDDYGKDGIQAIMSGSRSHGDPLAKIVSAKTVRFLIENSLIEYAHDGITDWKISAEGRLAIGV